MRDADRKLESSPLDPDELAKLLNIELIQKRVEWQRSHARHRSLRAIAFLFLFLIIAGALAAYFFFATNAPSPRPADREPKRNAAAGPNR